MILQDSRHGVWRGRFNMLKQLIKYWLTPSLCLCFASTLMAEKYAETWQDESLHSMSNEELLEAAKSKRNSQMSHTQQALNYQWMAQHANETGPKRSNKALKKALKKHFKQYWVESGAKKKRYNGLKDDSKLGKTNYGLKMSGDTVKLAFEHRFF